MNQILINILTRKFQRSVRLPEGDVPGNKGAGLSKSAASRHFVALLAAPLKEWMASDLSSLNLLVIQIDGIRMDKDMTLVAAVGVDSTGDKHPLGALEGATENAVTVQALIDNLVERGLYPAVSWLFIVEGAKALSRAIRASLVRETWPISAVRSTRRATSWSFGPNRHMPRSGASCDRLGRWTMRTGPNNSCVISHGVWKKTGEGFPRRFSRGLIRCSPSRGSDCRLNYDGRWPAPISSRMLWAR
jgi:hypothetical protein